MNAVIAASLITAIGVILAGATTYWFTKARERDAELRKEKLEHYRNFTLAMSGVIGDEITNDGRQAFALACNNLNLIASQNVLIALNELQQEIQVSNPDKSRERHDILLSQLFYEIRRDLNVSPKDKATTFHISLRAAGISPSQS